MSHHLIRYLTLEFNLLCNLVKTSTNKNDDNQIITILRKMSTKQIKQCNKSEYINILRSFTYKKFKNSYEDIIPILIFDDDIDNIYHKYSNKLRLIIERIQIKIRNSIVNYEMPNLCSLECVIMMFMIHTSEDGIYSEVDIMQVYSIIDAYNYCKESFSPYHCKKYSCRCNHVIYKMNDDTILVDDKLKELIVNHHSIIKNIDNIYNKYQMHISEKYNMNDVKYNVLHAVFYSVGDFRFFHKFTAIGYTDDSIIYIIVAPQYNKLNHEQFLIKQILLNYMISNVDEKTKNYNRYINKKIYTCIFTLDTDIPIFNELNIDKNDENISLILKKYLFYKYSEYNEIIYKFYNYCKNDIDKPKNISSVKYIIEQIKIIINNQERYGKEKRKFPTYILNFFKNINKQIEFGCNKDKNAIKNVMNKILTFEEFNINMNLFLHDEIY
jgi:hypothetical protein